MSEKQLAISLNRIESYWASSAVTLSFYLSKHLYLLGDIIFHMNDQHTKVIRLNRNFHIHRISTTSFYAHKLDFVFPTSYYTSKILIVSVILGFIIFKM